LKFFHFSCIFIIRKKIPTLNKDSTWHVKVSSKSGPRRIVGKTSDILWREDDVLTRSKRSRRNSRDWKGSRAGTPIQK
jgi:hypothetical protein